MLLHFFKRQASAPMPGTTAKTDRHADRRKPGHRHNIHKMLHINNLLSFL
jgi:hypothetical protein